MLSGNKYNTGNAYNQQQQQQELQPTIVSGQGSSDPRYQGTNDPNYDNARLNDPTYNANPNYRVGVNDPGHPNYNTYNPAAHGGGVMGTVKAGMAKAGDKLHEAGDRAQMKLGEMKARHPDQPVTTDTRYQGTAQGAGAGVTNPNYTTGVNNPSYTSSTGYAGPNNPSYNARNVNDPNFARNVNDPNYSTAAGYNDPNHPNYNARLNDPNYDHLHNKDEYKPAAHGGGVMGAVKAGVAKVADKFHEAGDKAKMKFEEMKTKHPDNNPVVGQGPAGQPVVYGANRPGATGNASTGQYPTTVTSTTGPNAYNNTYDGVSSNTGDTSYGGATSTNMTTGANSSAMGPNTGVNNPSTVPGTHGGVISTSGNRL